MKLVYFKYTEDFGHEWQLSFFRFKKYTILQMSFDYNDYPGWPYLQITSGMGRVFGILFCVWRFGFCLDFLGNSWWSCYDDMESLKDFEDLKNGN